MNIFTKVLSKYLHLNVPVLIVINVKTILSLTRGTFDLPFVTFRFIY